MKKGLLIFSLIISATIIAVYFFIPVKQHFTHGITINCTEEGAIRQIINKDKWQSWWPGEKKNDCLFLYMGYSYKFDKILYNGIETTVFNNKDSVKGFLQFLYYGIDSTRLQWTSADTLSTNPFKRIVEYFQSRKLKSNVESLLTGISTYFNQEENIYGFKVKKQKQTETSLVSFKQTFDHYPSTQEVYTMIQTLKEYIREKGGEEKDVPMLHVHHESIAVYETMIAIPVKTELAAEGNFQLKRMMMGSILMAEIKGGVASVTTAEQELINYAKDYKKTAPAIPFQSLVTNRLLETDTSKWVTRLYYPVMY